MLSSLKRLPSFAWLSDYRWSEHLTSDLIAGLTVGVMLVPQGMAYAMLAGLPPVVGLYASALPLLAYALIGTSRQLAVGPVAMDSLLVATGAALVAEPGSPQFLTAAILLAALAGLVQVAMGLLRLGFLVNFLSKPVISGFTSAAAIVIGLSQLKHLLGVPLGRSSTLQGLVVDAAPRLGETHLPTLFVGLGAVVLMVVLRRLWPKLPGALLVVVLGTLITAQLGWSSSGVRIVGEVPQGLPALSLPTVPLQMLQELFPVAVVIALIGFLEAISVAKALASKHEYEVYPNQELLGLGAANLAAALSSAFPVTGGFSRSAVNERAGARSPIAALSTAFVVLLTLVAFTPLFYFLPNAILASIVMVAVSGLIDVKEALRLWRVRRADAGLLLLTFGVTLFVGIGQGIVAGVMASLIAFIHRSTRPHTAELGRLPGSNVFRNLKNFPEAEPVPGVLILRMDASFYFANVAFFKERLESFLLRGDPKTDTVLIDASSMNDLDSSAEAALEETVKRLRARGKDLFMANVKGPVRTVMRRSGLWRMLGDDHVFFDLPSAVAGIAELRARKRRARDPSRNIESEPPRLEGLEPRRSARGMA